MRILKYQLEEYDPSKEDSDELDDLEILQVCTIKAIKRMVCLMEKLYDQTGPEDARNRIFRCYADIQGTDKMLKCEE